MRSKAIAFSQKERGTKDHAASHGSPEIGKMPAFQETPGSHRQSQYPMLAFSVWLSTEVTGVEDKPDPIRRAQHPIETDFTKCIRLEK